MSRDPKTVAEERAPFIEKWLTQLRDSIPDIPHLRTVEFEIVLNFDDNVRMVVKTGYEKEWLPRPDAPLQ